MSKGLKSFLGFLSILGFLFVPILLAYLFIAFVPQMIALEQQGIEPSPEQVLPMVGTFIAVTMLIAFISFGLMIFYIIHVAQDKSATSNDRILWILLLVFFSNFVLPFYWYFRIWKEKSVDSSSLDSSGYSG